MGPLTRIAQLEYFRGNSCSLQAFVVGKGELGDVVGSMHVETTTHLGMVLR